MSNQNLKVIVSSHDKKVDEAHNALARLFRIVLRDLDIDLEQMHTLINRYVKRENAKVADPNLKSSLKTNLIAALSNKHISFKFFEKFAKILDPDSVTFSVTFHWKNGTSSTHSVDMEFVDDDLNQGR